MKHDPMYHDGMRKLQDARDTRRLADRLEKVTVHTAFADEDRAFIERCPMIFVARMPMGIRIVPIKLACLGSCGCSTTHVAPGSIHSIPVVIGKGQGVR